MKGKGLLTLFASLAALLFAATTFGQLTVPGQKEEPQKSQTQGEQEATTGAIQQTQEEDLLSAHRLIGSNVQNVRGQELGEITNFLVDPETGQVAFVILNTGGGFIGGENARVVPFKALEAKGGDVSLDMDQQQLAKAPTWEPGMSSEDFDRRSAEFFGVAPIWEENKK